MPQPLVRRVAAAALCFGLYAGLGAPLPAAAQEGLQGEVSPVPIKAAEDMWAVEPKMVYPQAARYLGLQARIVAKVVVDSTGKPVKTQIVQRDPIHVDAFDESIRTALMKSRVRLPAWVEPGWYYALDAPFNFMLQGSGDDSPRPLQVIAPVMPPEALEQGVEGWVSVLVKVDADGRPEMKETRVMARALPQFKFFDASALEAVGKTRFSPTRLQDRSLSRWTLVRVDFPLPQP